MLFAGVVALLVGLAAGLVVAGLMSIDFVAWDDVPVERAVITSTTVSATERVACGRSLWPDTAARTTTFSVEHPRPGFPAAFSVAGCGLGLHPGETVLLQRRPGATEDDLMLGGSLTLLDFVQVAGTIAGIGCGLTFGVTLLVTSLQPRWQRWVAARRQTG